MALSSSILDRFFRNSDLTIGLARKGVEVTDLGYQRMGSRWTITPSQARTAVTFGPFVDNAEFDSVVVMEAGEVIDRISIGLTVLPAGTVWDQSLIVSIDNG